MEDYKEKYEQALKRARTLHKLACETSHKNTRMAIEELFPELKESEDERIRKWLIKAMKYLSEESTFFLEVPKDKVIDWLEKQDPKKHEEELEKAYKTADEVQYRKGYEDAKKELEKQGEQKLIDKIQLGKKYKCIASPRYSTFMIGEIYKPEDKFLCSLMNFCSDCFELIEDGDQKITDKVEPKFKVGDGLLMAQVRSKL